uniref:Uncharacterized protein n=1 Tax=Caenorhabditis japonica TaxID=281687 RepID=A0A8R1ERF8_CAEJA
MSAGDLTPSVASMSIFGAPKTSFDSPATPSVFSRQHRQMVRQEQIVTPARSLFGPPRSLAPPNNERNQFMPDSGKASQIFEKRQL